ncbi:MAG TPA: S8 family serine peptidase [Blastocatellia bacterium]|nr:S8 family serine peptidase [Blastocatellia bacterium]
MKRFIILSSIMIFVTFFTTVTAMMQDRLRPQLNAREDLPQREPVPDALPQNHLNQNRLHKIIINREESDVYDQLAQQNAIRDEIDYGSFKLVVVDEEAAGGRDVLQAMRIAPSDEQNMIALNGYVIDTSALQPLSKELPADLKQSRMAQARAGRYNPGGGLYIVQFAGPIRDAWLNTLKSTGANVVSYVSNNAYVVRCDARSATMISRMKDEQSFVQWVGDYEPAYKLEPSMQMARKMGDSSFVKVTVQILDGKEGDQQVFNLRSSSRQFIGENRVMNYRNITAVIPASQLTELAASDGVFAIEEAGERVRSDEAQGQIVAGNLSGNSPSGPGYLEWLASKGFTSSQFRSFAVNVVDDAYSLTGHPDLPNARIAFQNNPTGQAGAQSGHGFLNAHIVGGFNSGMGSEFEDANGFNYGLGIAPWARVGVTAIFGQGSYNPRGWEYTAYGQGARISTNSWNHVGTYRYDINAQEYDLIVRDAEQSVAGNQQLIVVFSASNDGPGANTVTSPGSAKNVITVGASENVRQIGTTLDIRADSANDISGFSSRGPVNAVGGDGRIKPDIVAPGTNIQAGVPQSNYDGSGLSSQFFPSGQTLYGLSSGTSHAAPAVAGGAALVYQHFLNSGLAAPSPAMTKAFLMNSAAHMTGGGAGGNLPSNSQGMGRMDLGRAFDGAQRIIVDQTQTLGETGQTFQVAGAVASTSQPLRVTLAWTDMPGPTTGSPVVNNLDLEVTINGQTFRGNVFSGANSTTGGAADPRNNVESVFLPAGTSGDFTVTVRAANIAGDGVFGNTDTTDQDFALVIYNGSPELIVNGGFEGSEAPWYLGYRAITSTGGNHHSGTGYLIEGGGNFGIYLAYQQITIPSGTSPSLKFWLNVTSAETGYSQFDRLTITVHNTSHQILATLATFSNLDKAPQTNAYTLYGPYDLSSFAGQTVRIQFYATNDQSLPTVFRVDDVSVR